MAVFYVVATPIGNLGDISQRAIEILKTVDLILCEDTRVTKRLLDYYQIKKPTLSYHQHSNLRRVEEIIKLLDEGKTLALVSDAGTPGVSDPGSKLVNLMVRELGDRVKIGPVPGPSALTAAASVSGFPMEKFLFLGFPPAKRKRKKFFEEILGSKYPVIFYESSHRIIRTLNELKLSSYLRHGVINTINMVVCRELTKHFETIYRGTIDKVMEEIERGKVKGEFVVIVDKP